MQQDSVITLNKPPDLLRDGRSRDCRQKWITTISATDHIGHSLYHIGHKQSPYRPQTTSTIDNRPIRIARMPCEMRKVGHYHRISGLATSSFTALPNRFWAEICQLCRVISKSCAGKTLLMTWVDNTSKYRHVSMRVEQRTSTRRNYQSTVIWATNHAQCLMTPAWSGMLHYHILPWIRHYTTFRCLAIA